jgi:hypothetical protein
MPLLIRESEERTRDAPAIEYTVLLFIK